MKAEGGDVEAQKPAHVPHMRLVLERGYCPPEVINHHHNGSGTEEDPYVVEWIPDDPCNPMGFSLFKKWAITILVAVATLAVALTSSAYTGGIREMMMQFNVGTEVVTLGVALFVLGFAIGPLLWAPLSELFGRQVLFFFTYGALTAFCAGAAGSQNIQTLIILRFFAGAFGSSPLTNAGGVIADMFPAAQRGLALSIFAAAPFLGPTLGPIIGGFLGMNAGWRWVEGFLAIFSGVIWIICSVLVPETYAPVLLRHRAQNLSKMTGKVYRSKLEIERGPVKLSEALKTSLLRPWVLLLFEPIVLLLSIYMAIIYGTLYMMFGAFPIVYQEERHWNEGIGGLAFLGVMVGMLSAVFTSIFDNKRYVRAVKKHGGFAPPEERLPLCLIGGILIPIGLFWFAWTNSPHVHWMASIAAGVPFGFGMVFVFLSVFNYLIDSYTIFAASVLAANAVLRSLFGTAFPLFTTYMYHNLGIHWASSIPAFLAVACVPFPFLFYKYGAQIRARCKFAATSEAFMRKLRESQAPPVAEAEDDKSSSSSDHGTTTTTHEPLSRTQTKQSLRSIRTQNSLYEGNPYDIDRVNSRESFTKLPHQIQHDVSRPSTATGGEKPPLAHSPIPEHHEHESHKP
ncbi:MFS general substrate transporter [Xylona heveae TC161]|uniref:MFS general substrate transporter n=1 Tax=Xylona heveae (strain CBS 132557 / TC161) TaxID=1328760 RepID=A0A165A2P9_XYLHT|nr:MFS general substrate transporter [Xylona heveae TC161]KZF19872.1 MFS general substrate transporter [Xylona heveae TC161]